jgi:hypothetical protein
MVSSLLLLSLLSADGKPVSVQVLSATTKDKVVSGAQVIFQKDGQPSQTATSDDAGKATLSSTFGVDDATVSLIVKKDGFSPLVVKCPCNGMSYAISETMKQVEQFRVVLNWGDKPADLDLHVVYPNNHIFFSAKQGTDAFLDVDDTDGFGPETITIKTRHQGEKYVFAVHNFSAGEAYGTKTLSNSRAKVFVYVGQSLIRSYYVRPEQVGALWVLFAVDDNGSLRDINQVIDVPETKKIVYYLKQLTQRSDFGVTARTSTADTESASKLVTQADEALKAAAGERAVELYQQAADLNPNLGSAYSGMVKAYEQLGRKAEAEWARRKGADLGKPPENGYRVPNDRITVTASSTLANWRQYTFTAPNLIDDNLWTSWQPKTNKATGGVNEWVKMTFNSPQTLTAFEVSNGFRRVDDFGDLYIANNRAKTANLEFSDGTSMPIEFKDLPTETTIVLQEPKTCTWVKMTVTSVYKGTKWPDLAISEMHPLSKE